MRNLFLIIAGYASTFCRLDKAQDIILPQAFKNLQSGIPILFGHKNHLKLGEILSLEERSAGLYMEGVIFCDKAWQKSLAKKIHQGRLSGLSIGIELEEVHNFEQGRLIEKANLLEISVTSQPVNSDCQIGFSQFFLVGDSGLEPPTSSV